MRKLLAELFLIILTIGLLFSGCASKPKFTGKGDLCGLIVDENNKPVSDFVVYCQSTDLITRIINPVLTNESGIFVFYDVPSGNYLISGEKNNYLKISKTPYLFSDRSKIFCLQTKSFRAALANAEEKIRLNQKKDADEILSNICCEPKSRESKYVMAYRFFTSEKDRERRKIISDLKKVKNENLSFFTDYATKLEEVSK